MVIKKMPENASNIIAYEINGNVIDFDDGELTIKLSKKERDDPVHLDICRDYMGGLVMGTGSTARSYVAQIDIPARRYQEVHDDDYDIPYGDGSRGDGTTDGEDHSKVVPVPFDIDRCTLTLWEMED